MCHWTCGSLTASAARCSRTCRRSPTERRPPMPRSQRRLRTREQFAPRGARAQTTLCPSSCPATVSCEPMEASDSTSVASKPRKSCSRWKGRHKTRPPEGPRLGRLLGVSPSTDAGWREGAGARTGPFPPRRSTPAGDLQDHAVAGDVVLNAHEEALAPRVEDPAGRFGAQIVQRDDAHAAVGELVVVVTVV